MTIYYTDIYKLVLGKLEAQSFLKYSDTEFYDAMSEYLHVVASYPFVRIKFEKLDFDDEVMELDAVLSYPVDDYSDKDFITNVFAEGIIVQWLLKKKNTELTINYAIYGKEEKAFSQSSHLKEIRTLYEEAFISFKKYIRDYGYMNNSYIRGGN